MPEGDKMIAEIIIDSSVKTLNRIFDYNIPKEMENNISIGSRVLVPFGRSKKLEEGFVTNIKESTEFEVKDIAKIEEQSLSTDKIVLSKWMAKRYFSNVSECMKLMLRPGTTTKNFANRTKDKTALFVSLNMPREQVLQYIQKKESELGSKSSFSLNLPLLIQHSRASNTALSLYWFSKPDKWKELYRR